MLHRAQSIPNVHGARLNKNGSNFERVTPASVEETPWLIYGEGPGLDKRKGCDVMIIPTLHPPGSAFTPTEDPPD